MLQFPGGAAVNSMRGVDDPQNSGFFGSVEGRQGPGFGANRVANQHE